MSERTIQTYYQKKIRRRLELQSSPLIITHADRVFKVHIIFKMSMIDGKMRQILSGQGGAFCMFCSCTREDVVCLMYTFTIDKSGAQIEDI